MRYLLSVFIALVFVGAAWAQPEGGRLTVIGEGRVDSPPDMATIVLGATSEAQSAAEALRQTSEATRAVLDRLEEAGIAARDMQTSDLSLSPVWDSGSQPDGRREIVGFQASNTVTVRVRALGELGGILDAVVSRGANTFRGLSFGLQDPAPALDEARRRAVAEARRKAELFAEAAGVALGPLVSLEEGGGGSGGPVMMERMAVAMDVPVAEGEVSTQASVTLVYAVEAAE